MPSARYVFVAGGIGITPLLPMITQADLVGADWTLLYGGRRRASMAFLDELAAYGDRVHVVPQDEAGLLPLASWLGEPRADTVKSTAAARRRCSRPSSRRSPRPAGRRTRCAPSGSPRPRPARPVRGRPVRGRARPHRHDRHRHPGRSRSLDAARDAGVDVLSSCRQGTCGTCETTVLGGVPDHRDSMLDDDERAAGDCMFPCVSRSCTDRLVLDL